MSGVVDANGVQWEHCNECGKFVRLENLGFQPYSVKWKGPCDICLDCTNLAPNIEDIIPAKSWSPQYEGEE